MNRKGVLFATGLLALLALVSMVSATVVTFDDTTYLSADYAGLTWDPQWVLWDSAASELYPPYSSPNVIYSHNFGGWIGFEKPVLFKGAWFSGPASYTSCHFEGYKDGVKIGDSPTLSMNPTPTFLNAGFTSPVDKVSVVCDNNNHFVVDDITYEEAGVNAPEFPVTALPVAMIIGMLGVILMIRRKED